MWHILGVILSLSTYTNIASSSLNVGVGPFCEDLREKRIFQ